MKGHVETVRAGYHKLVIEMGRDATGKRNRRAEYFHGKRADADRRLIEVLTQLEQGTLVDKTKISLGDFLDQWIVDYAEPKVAPSTLQRYRGLVENNIKPFVGSLRLSSLKSLHVEQLYRDLRSKGRVGCEGGLSEQTVLHVHRLISKALKQAVRWGLLAKSPMDLVDAPSVQRTEMCALDTDQSLAFIEAVKDTRYRTPIVVALGTGMRRGELLGLKWGDIDLEAETLTVSRSLTEVGGSIVEKTPKSRRGSRTILMPKFVVQELKQHRTRQTTARLSLGLGWSDRDLVFCDDKGDYWKPNTFASGYRKLAKRLGYKVRFHDLRHSAASQLLKLGIPLVMVSQILGHSSPSVTNNTYSHVLTGMQEEAAKRIGEAYASLGNTNAEAETA